MHFCECEELFVPTEASVETAAGQRTAFIYPPRLAPPASILRLNGPPARPLSAVASYFGPTPDFPQRLPCDQGARRLGCGGMAELYRDIGVPLLAATTTVETTAMVHEGEPEQPGLARLHAVGCSALAAVVEIKPRKVFFWFFFLVYNRYSHAAYLDYGEIIHMKIPTTVRKKACCGFPCPPPLPVPGI